MQRTVSPEFGQNGMSVWLIFCWCGNSAAFAVVLDPLELLDRAKDESILSATSFDVINVDIGIEQSNRDMFLNLIVREG